MRSIAIDVGRDLTREASKGLSILIEPCVGPRDWIVADVGSSASKIEPWDVGVGFVSDRPVFNRVLHGTHGDRFLLDVGSHAMPAC